MQARILVLMLHNNVVNPQCSSFKFNVSLSHDYHKLGPFFIGTACGHRQFIKLIITAMSQLTILMENSCDYGVENKTEKITEEKIPL